MVLATDEVYTYAIFNYADITWSSHTEAGGDTTGGEGGVPAYVRLLYLFSMCRLIILTIFRLGSTLVTEHKLMNTNHTVKLQFCVI